jgi:hypothetical protein
MKSKPLIYSEKAALIKGAFGVQVPPRARQEEPLLSAALFALACQLRQGAEIHCCSSIDLL